MSLADWNSLLATPLLPFLEARTHTVIASLCFDSFLNVDVAEFQTNLVPYPASTSCAVVRPIISADIVYREQLSATEIFNAVV